MNWYGETTSLGRRSLLKQRRSVSSFRFCHSSCENNDMDFFFPTNRSVQFHLLADQREGSSSFSPPVVFTMLSPHFSRTQHGPSTDLEIFGDGDIYFECL